MQVRAQVKDLLVKLRSAKQRLNDLIEAMRDELEENLFNADSDAVDEDEFDQHLSKR